MAGLGDEFRAAREARHLSLPDVSDHIHIRAVYLQGIEAEDWAALAAPVYARGFIRTYARFLGLDGERAVAEYGRALGDAPLKASEPSFRQPSRQRRSPWLWLATVVAACLVGYVAFSAVRLVQENRRSTAALGAHPPAARSTAGATEERSSAATAASASPQAGASARPRARASQGPATGTSPGPAAARATTSRTLEVRLTQRAWLAIKVDDAQKLIGVFPAGTRRVYRGTTASVRTGNGAGVELTLNGKKLGPMGASGAVVERRLALSEE